MQRSLRFGALALLLSVPASKAQTGAFEGLDGTQRREMADSLRSSGLQALHQGDFESALQLIDAALLADPSHYRLWVERWELLVRSGEQEGQTDAELAAVLSAELTRVAEGEEAQDAVYVLGTLDELLWELTGDEAHRRRHEQRLGAFLAENPQATRSFDFHLALATSLPDDAAARRHFLAAQQLATTPARRRAWSQAAIERGIERPAFLSDEGVRAALTQWHSTFAEIADQAERVRAEANLVLWHARLSLARGDTATVARLIPAWRGLRNRLISYEARMLNEGWDAPIRPLAILDARAEETIGDLHRLRGDAAAAAAAYRRAWSHMAPIFDTWDRSRQLFSGEHMRTLRARLAGHLGLN